MERPERSAQAAQRDALSAAAGLPPRHDGKPTGATGAASPPRPPPAAAAAAASPGGGGAGSPFGVSDSMETQVGDPDATRWLGLERLSPNGQRARGLRRPSLDRAASGGSTGARTREASPAPSHRSSEAEAACSPREAPAAPPAPPPRPPSASGAPPRSPAGAGGGAPPPPRPGGGYGHRRSPSASSAGPATAPDDYGLPYDFRGGGGGGGGAPPAPPPRHLRRPPSYQRLDDAPQSATVYCPPSAEPHGPGAAARSAEAWALQWQAQGAAAAAGGHARGPGSVASSSLSRPSSGGSGSRAGRAAAAHHARQPSRGSNAGSGRAGSSVSRMSRSSSATALSASGANEAAMRAAAIAALAGAGPRAAAAAPPPPLVPLLRVRAAPPPGAAAAPYAGGLARTKSLSAPSSPRAGGGAPPRAELLPRVDDGADDAADLERFLAASAPALAPPPAAPGAAAGAAAPPATLSDLWRWFEPHSAFGLEVPTLGAGAPAACFFVPYLSAVQLYAPAKGGESSAGGGESGAAGAAGANGGGAADAAGGADGAGGLFEYPAGLDSWPPAMRRRFAWAAAEPIGERAPLHARVAELCGAAGAAHPLAAARLADLHPYSWFAVAWYPLYRIPDAAPLAARFLTFHSLAPACEAARGAAAASAAAAAEAAAEAAAARAKAAAPAPARAPRSFKSIVTGGGGGGEGAATPTDVAGSPAPSPPTSDGAAASAPGSDATGLSPPASPGAAAPPPAPPPLCLPAVGLAWHVPAAGSGAAGRARAEDWTAPTVLVALPPGAAAALARGDALPGLRGARVVGVRGASAVVRKDYPLARGGPLSWEIQQEELAEGAARLALGAGLLPPPPASLCPDYDFFASRAPR